MKRRLAVLLLAVLLIALGLGILKICEQPTEAGVAKGHLDWDSGDEIWRCVGTPKDCAFPN